MCKLGQAKGAAHDRPYVDVVHACLWIVQHQKWCRRYGRQMSVAVGLYSIVAFWASSASVSTRGTSSAGRLPCHRQGVTS